MRGELQFFIPDKVLEPNIKTQTTQTNASMQRQLPDPAVRVHQQDPYLSPLARNQPQQFEISSEKLAAPAPTQPKEVDLSQMMGHLLTTPYDPSPLKISGFHSQAVSPLQAPYIFTMVA